MTERTHTYIAIDLKSFYASVECRERGLDPLTTHLVVADSSRTEKTICLAVSPSLKAYGIAGRARLFEVVQQVRKINYARLQQSPEHRLTGRSAFVAELDKHPDWALDYIVAPPRMSHYIACSSRIYQIYLRRIAPDDIHVYSIDEVFIDATQYLETYKMTAHELAQTLIHDVLRDTGITATAGIGPNLYLCKVAMDIEAKHIAPDERGVRIAELDEMTYRRKLWDFKPLTSFWRVGYGIANRLASLGIDTMGKLARFSIENEETLYRLFGVNAELLIDHAWGWEPCTMAHIKAYKPEAHSLSSGQVLQCAYDFDKALVVACEMADAMALDLVAKHLVTCDISLTIGYDSQNLTMPLDGAVTHMGTVVFDHYGRLAPKPAHGTVRLQSLTSSTKALREATSQLFHRIVDPRLLVRRLYLVAGHVVDESLAAQHDNQPAQLELFTDYEAIVRHKTVQKRWLAKERKMQETVLDIKRKFGKNAILSGLNFKDGATMRERNLQIGGHKA